MFKEILKKAQLQSKYDLFINGQWVKPTSGKYLESHSPINGEKLADFSEATDADVDKAVEAAHAAQKEWRKVSIEKRSAILLKIADVIDANAERLALIETLDNGKPIRETLYVDIPNAADHFRYFAAVIRSETGSAQTFDENSVSLIIREPIGVVGQIVPWNFPFLMACWKLAPALATGNTIVFHPSSSTSLSVLELIRLIAHILPDGVLNLITGKGSKSGQYMLDHPGFDKLAFTGSTAVGYNVAKAAAEKMIPATLELGGKSANIVFDDAQWDKALEGVLLAILFNQGQVCCAGSRLFLQEGIYDKFLSDLKMRFEKVKVGLPWEASTQMSCQINEGQVKKILEYVEIGKKEGAKLVTGGRKITENGLEKGCFVTPTIFADVHNDMRIAQEEIFGPFLVVIKFKTVDEVIQLANHSDYGLAGGVFTQDINQALRVARGVRTGRMWVNCYNELRAGTPFGGYKKSGIGRETDKQVLNAYSETKNIYIDCSGKTKGLYE